MRVHLSAYLVVSVCLTGLQPTWAQVSRASQDPPGTIDGAKTPELISDETALAMFFRALNEPEQATEFEKKRSKALARSAGLTEADTDNLIRLSCKLNSEIAILDGKAAQIHAKRAIEAAAMGRTPSLPADPTSDDGRFLTSLTEDRKATIGRILLELHTTMSLNGADKFTEYLQTVKRKIKVIPD